MGSSVYIDPQYDGIVMLSPDIVFFNDAQPRPDGRKIYHIFEQNEGLTLPDEMAEIIDKDDFELKRRQLISKASENSLQNIQQTLAKNGINIENWINVPKDCNSLVSVESPQTLLANSSYLKLNSFDPLNSNSNDSFESALSDDFDNAAVEDPDYPILKKSSVIGTNSPLDRRKSHRLKSDTKVSAKNARKWIGKMSNSLETLEFEESNNYSEPSEINHSLFESSSDTSKCDICFELIEISFYDSHMQTHFKKGNNIKVKKEIFEKLSTFRKHYFLTNAMFDPKGYQAKSHIETNPLVCEICHFMCEDAVGFKVHMETHDLHDFDNKEETDNFQTANQNSFRLFKCDMCGLKTKYLNNLKVHIRRHNGEKPFSCPYCDYKTDRPKSLEGHIKRLHENDDNTNTGEISNLKREFDNNKAATMGHKILEFSEKFNAEHKANDHPKTHYKDNALLSVASNFSATDAVKMEDCSDMTSSFMSSSLSNENHSQDYQIVKCDFCDFKSEDLHNLREHMTRHYEIEELDTTQTKIENHLINYNNKRAKTKDAGPSEETNSMDNFSQETLDFPGVFKCSLCSFTTSTKYDLNQHGMFHICNYCTFCCDDPSDMEIHHETMHKMNGIEKTESKKIDVKSNLIECMLEGTKFYKCNLCSFQSKYLSYVKVHIQRHDGKKPYACPHCDFRSAHSSNLNTHFKSHHQNIDNPKKIKKLEVLENEIYSNVSLLELADASELLKCTICNFVTKVKCEFDFHFKTHNEKKPYICNLCNFTTEDMLEITAHVDAFHSLNNDQFASSDIKPELDDLISDKQKDKSYKCNNCNYESTILNLFQDHLKSHQANLVFCSHCEFKTTHSRNLRNHIKKIHFSETTLYCSHCSFYTIDRILYKNHLQEHREGKFACSFCKYQTSSRANLVQHTRVHTGEKPYQCKHCDHKCSQKSSLNVHQKIHIERKVLD